ncbi:MAG: glycosyltransferase family 2 protein, partial [Nocardioidaceae bacterium]
MSLDPDSAAHPLVTLIVVSHDGQTWIPRLLEALKASTVLPGHLVAVDTGSTDESRQLLASVLGDDAVIELAATAGFGQAVAAGLSAADASANHSSGRHQATSTNCWVWLLHDDCAPDSRALAELLEVAATDNSIGVVGCRIRAWPRARRLLELGVSISGTGRRETVLEPGEYDQGQHDEVRDALAVSSAGMLVRRDVWSQLGGFDPALPLFRDDVDFGWRATKAGHRVVVAPHALLFHAEAATRGVRAIDNANPSPHRADRAAAIFTLLANCSWPALPIQYVRLCLGSLLRMVAYVVGKLPSAAADEVMAMLSVLGRPHSILSARLARRGTSSAPHSKVRARLPPWWTPYARGIDAVLTTLSEKTRLATTSVATSTRGRGAARRALGESDGLDLPDHVASRVNGAGPSWVVRHGLLCLTVILTVGALIAGRGLWGGGFLQGGALLPAPDDAGHWWSLYVESWHAVGLGSDLATAPYVALLAVAGSVLAGKAWLVVDLLMLMAVPLAALGAHAAARRLVSGRLTRLWVALAYAVLPVVTGAVSTGHIGTVAGVLVFPWLVRAAMPLFDDDVSSWRPAWACAIWLAVLAAFVPLAWVLCVGLAVV